jgi:glycerophosphoryl diester phosphodiesterase
MFGISERALVIGHRGGAGGAPENTLESIRHGVEAGAYGIEFDIHATRDGRILLFHDDTLERTTDGAGVVEEMTLEQLQRLDAGHGSTPDFGRSLPDVRWDFWSGKLSAFRR